MTKKNFITFFSIFYFLSGSTLGYTQVSEKNNTALVSILEKIEQDYDVSFSYADKLLEDIFITTPSNTKTLRDILLQISSETDLLFEFLTPNTIAIKPERKNLFSDENTQILPEITLTKYLTNGLYKKPNGSILLHPKKQNVFPGLSTPDVLHTIQLIPGVTSIDETPARLTVRGGMHDQNLILWENIKMYQSGHFFGLISIFNPFLTQSVSLSKNGSSVLYGDGISSVIDMKLSDKISTKNNYGIGFNAISIDGFSKINITKKTSIQLAVRRSITDLINTPTHKSYSDYIFQNTEINNNTVNQTASLSTDFYFYDFSGKVIYRSSEKSQLSVSFINTHNSLAHTKKVTIETTEHHSQLTQQNLGIGIHYFKKWKKNISSKTQLYISNYNLNAINQNNNTQLTQENGVLETALKHHFTILLNNKNTLHTGYQLIETGVANLENVTNPLFQKTEKKVILNQAIYAENKFVSGTKKTKLDLGIRINYFEKFKKIIFEPRLSFNQSLSKNINLEILGELKNQTTSQIIELQNDFLGLEKRRWVLANNSDIPLMESAQLSTGLNYKKNNLLITIEGYLKQVNGITTRSQGFDNQYQYTNHKGKYFIKGIDVLFNRQSNYFDFWFAYTLSKNHYTFKALNNGEAFLSNNDVRHFISTGSSYRYKQLKLAIGTKWHSGKTTTTLKTPETLPSGEINYNKANNDRLGDYFQLNFSGAYTFKHSKTTSTLSVSVLNVLNTKNDINRHYISSNEDSINTVTLKALGLTPNISYRFNF